MITFRLQYFTHWGENLVIRLEGQEHIMDNDGQGNWYITLPVPQSKSIAYTYAVIENGKETRHEWREHTQELPSGTDAMIFNDSWIDRPAAPFYAEEFSHIVGADKVSRWRGAGVAIPVFSLRSKKSFGIGEFADIPLLVDWAEKTGMSVIQLLPINDTTMTGTWKDSYPYNANSTFALHPAYIRLETVGHLSDKQKMKAFAELQKELNALPQLDYERVTKAKWEYLRLIYAEKGAKTLSSPSFRQFFETNAYWLRPYSVFCFLRDKFGTPDFKKWKGVKYSESLIDSMAPTASEFKAPLAPEKADVAFHMFIQFHLHTQLKKSVDYAHAHGVVLKGDIPIGISRTSVDAWAYPHLFHMNGQAGAPPDAFAADGQNWGFPTYDWKAMEKEEYRWFRHRFQKMSDYFDAYRIDHLLGFFRIWEIPTRYKSGLLGHFNPAMPYSAEEICNRLALSKEELEALSTLNVNHKPETDVLFVQDEYRAGYFHPRISGNQAPCFSQLNDWQQKQYEQLHEEFFYHRHNDFWAAKAMEKLPALIDATDMLVCGEDLGMIPACVPSVMQRLSILSLEIQQMPKDVGVTFGDPSKYPYDSVCTTSSHDMSNIRAWWEEDRELTQKYWEQMLHRTGEAPAVCEPWICKEIIHAHMTSPSMLAILPLQDWLGIDATLRYANPAEERINVPSNPDNYWRYRMHLTLEQLNAADAFNDEVRELACRPQE
ncbi:MAG: 4-alpha-glucanotransferase [Bacteroidaceae bacterium]|nr:4-alpha-glucanotransferase [Bacteroidaceae bacterium]